jgi:hypothetical protein
MCLASLIGGDDASATLLISVLRWCPLIQRPKTRKVGCNLANRMIFRIKEQKEGQNDQAALVPPPLTFAVLTGLGTSIRELLSVSREGSGCRYSHRSSIFPS